MTNGQAYYHYKTFEATFFSSQVNPIFLNCMIGTLINITQQSLMYGFIHVLLVIK